MPAPALLTGALFGAALLLTLALASVLTPRSWWKRPNLLAFAVLAGGTWAFGHLFLLACNPPLAQAHAAPLLAERSYIAFHDLNLRSAASVDAVRLAVVPEGASVTATGLRQGDWWQLRASVGRQQVTGWSSSLWLRRTDER